MKRLIVASLLIFAVSCSNPEDRAVANGDSTKTNPNKVLNSRPGPTDPDSKTGVDSSSSEATSKANADSATNGTNRPYGTTADSSKKP